MFHVTMGFRGESSVISIWVYVYMVWGSATWNFKADLQGKKTNLPCSRTVPELQGLNASLPRGPQKVHLLTWSLAPEGSLQAVSPIPTISSMLWQLQILWCYQDQCRAHSTGSENPEEQATGQSLFCYLWPTGKISHRFMSHSKSRKWEEIYPKLGNPW